MRPGRPAGSPPNRQAILTAARRKFAEHGYNQATIRAIAADAGVDPALVHHYFGTKAQLFAAAHAFPVDPRQVLPMLLEGDRGDLGARLVAFFLQIMGADPAGEGNPVIGLLRSAVTHDSAAAMLREFVSAEVLGPLAESLAVPDPQLRASLASSQLIGLAVARYVVRLEPLVTADDEVLTAWYGPTIQRYLTAPDADQ